MKNGRYQPILCTCWVNLNQNSCLTSVFFVCRVKFYSNLCLCVRYLKINTSSCCFFIRLVFVYCVECRRFCHKLVSWVFSKLRLWAECLNINTPPCGLDFATQSISQGEYTLTYSTKLAQNFDSPIFSVQYFNQCYFPSETVIPDCMLKCTACN